MKALISHPHGILIYKIGQSGGRLIGSAEGVQAPHSTVEFEQIGRSLHVKFYTDHREGDCYTDLVLENVLKTDAPIAGLSQAKGTVTAPPIDTGTIKSRLRKLKAIYDDGLISADDYEKKKAALLEQL
jgi:hypothetical protein